MILGEVEYGAPENGARYWRVPLVRGDSLVLDLSNAGLSGRDRPIRFCLLAPNVTDSSLRRSACAWERTLERGEKYRLRFSAPSRGSWTLGAVSSTCSTFQSCAAGNGSQPFVYEFTVHVRHFTRTTLRGPGAVRPGARLTFTGVVAGATSGRVEMQTAASGGPWKPRGAATIRRNGAFRWSTRAPSTAGSHRVRAVYRGDDSHLPSQTIHAYRVAGGG